LNPRHQLSSKASVLDFPYGGCSLSLSPPHTIKLWFEPK
jgi:hypothetical protein